ncbi:hypothetical protein DB34_07160 [Acetobacter pasteurianus]|nr:hypothetical protein DB34_07160 [Acetobacter pasteurianus]
MASCWGLGLLLGLAVAGRPDGCMFRTCVARGAAPSGLYMLQALRWTGQFVCTAVPLWGTQGWC